MSSDSQRQRKGSSSRKTPARNDANSNCIQLVGPHAKILALFGDPFIEQTFVHNLFTNHVPKEMYLEHFMKFESDEAEIAKFQEALNSIKLPPSL